MVHNIEKGFFKLLQSDVILLIGDKRYKGGRFLNFKIKEFYVQLDLVVKDKYRKIDIPLPFTVEDIDNGVVFSYRLEDMGSYGSEILKMFQNTIGGGKSKLYNKQLVIKRVIDEEDK